MNKIIIVFFMIIILVQQDFAQVKEDTNFVKVDNTNFINANALDHLYSPKLFNANTLGKKYLSKHNIILLNHTLLSYKLNIDLFYMPINQSNIDELKSFKKSMSVLLIKEYKKRNKYDLGKVGQFLGLTRDVTAIIIAILSL